MMNFLVSSVKNPLKTDYVHEYAGQKFKIKAGTVVSLPEAVANDVAYHLAQRVCKERGFQNFSNEWEEVRKELLGQSSGIEKVEDVSEEIPDFDLPADSEENVVELSGSGILDEDAFVPETKKRSAKKE